MVSWLLKIAAVEDFLQGLGSNPEVIQWIGSLDDSQLAGWYTNQVRKNPQISLQEMQSLKPPIPQEPPYTESEISRTVDYDNDPTFRQWALVQYRKHRYQRIQDAPRQRYRGGPVQEIPVNYSYDPAAVILDNVIGQIYDWYRATNPEIASYDFETARAASDQWHHQAATAGEGQEYDGSETVVYTYPNGWKVVQIHSANDLEVEGNRMNHCVGSYCDEVDSGMLIILSLRDPNNEPHVTMEMDMDGGIKQIQGNSNSIPKREYREMLRQFWNTPEAQAWLPQATFQGDMSADNYGGDPKFHSSAYRDETEIMEQLQDADDDEIIEIVKGLSGMTDEYGLPQDPASLNFGDLYVATVDALTKGGDRDGYYPQYRDIAESFATMAYEADWSMVRNKPSISKADFREYSRIRELMKHVNSINNNHLDTLRESADVQYELNDDPEYGEYHVEPSRVEQTVNQMLEDAQNTLPVALGNDVMEYLLKLKQERGSLQNANGEILY